jgi:hypothetical protein
MAGKLRSSAHGRTQPSKKKNKSRKGDEDNYKSVHNDLYADMERILKRKVSTHREEVFN